MINGNCHHPSVRHGFKFNGIPGLSRCIAYRNWKCIYLVLKPSFQYKPCLLLLADNHIDLLQSLWDFSIQQLPQAKEGGVGWSQQNWHFLVNCVLNIQYLPPCFLKDYGLLRFKNVKYPFSFLKVFQVNWDSGKVGHTFFFQVCTYKTQFSTAGHCTNNHFQ